ncbi:Putative peptidase M3A/M3B catalytic domain, neurolysin/Thimet oligopeptidase, domain 2 [Colletotrichum destructivum]|uniref:Peptidase M3A/M3B catalytic domain, neurolysin/Thimet oligopeptidase, domain 2 n=1 Tax=Colletotrichum destructivum TaxID=34406 RepID=A0AAX4I5R6_9PEZI|nr:Putative peptidase M3A/M3B catalytic domain, neurolysin/Thimet oligopeptidase, domain 2 [Colletotrichum destructivum]
MPNLTMSTRHPPRKPPVFTITPTDIITDINRLISASQAAQLAITDSVTTSNATYDKVLLALSRAENALAAVSTLLLFHNAVSPSPEVRDASAKARSILREFELECSMNEDLFRLVDAVYNNSGEVQGLEPEARNYLNKKHKEFVKNGLRIPAGPKRDRFKEIRSRIESLTSEFSKSLAEADVSVWFTPDELDGYPQDSLARLEKGEPGGESEGKLRIRIPNHLTLVLRTVRNPETRKRARLAFENRCPENVAVFREVVVLRHEAARLLGYTDHASLSVEDKMAESPRRVDAFLSSLRSKLAKAGEAERETLLRLKQRDVEARGETFDGRHFFIWDVPYYRNLLSREQYSVDHETISEYFPLQATVGGMLRIFEHLFGMAFHEIEGDERDRLSSTGKGDDLVWHPDVQILSVWDAESEGSGFLGYLYLDLYQRDGKRGSPANFSLIPGFTNPDGSRTHPSTALICAFAPPPSAHRPTLLRHSDVVMLFHELGHGIHDLVSRTQLARFHGPMGTVVDFGEAPSQMLENWCWTPTQLRGLSRHYSYLSEACLEDWRARVGQEDARQPPEKIPEDVVEGLIEARHGGQVLGTLHQLLISIFDMAVHQLAGQDAVESVDFTQLWNRLRREIVPTDDPSVLGEGDGWGHGYTNIGHLMDEYDAGYYGYFFSKVYAQDIFTNVFKEGPMSQGAGRRYRYGVLEKGGSRPEMKTLTDFLGRDVRMEPFYEDLGLTV